MSKGEWYFGEWYFPEWYFPEYIFPNGILANVYFPSGILASSNLEDTESNQYKLLRILGSADPFLSNLSL